MASFSFVSYFTYKVLLRLYIRTSKKSEKELNFDSIICLWFNVPRAFLDTGSDFNTKLTSIIPWTFWWFDLVILSHLALLSDNKVSPKPQHWLVITGECGRCPITQYIISPVLDGLSNVEQILNMESKISFISYLSIL